MPIKRYGVLRGKALAGKLEGQGGRKPHYQIHILADGVDHRIAVNVVSDQSPSELLFLLDPDFRHPQIEKIKTVPVGFTDIPLAPGGLALDFQRSNLFLPADMKALPFDVPGLDNDLNEIFDLYVRRAIERNADVYAFGSKWGPETNKPDAYFHFKPGNGIHDIHMNQGSPPPHKGDNAIWQDGALFIHFPVEDKWLAFFLAFQSQHAQTDNAGHPVPGSPKFGPASVVVGGGGVEAPAAAGVNIVAALVNPPGNDVGLETVTLLNARPEPVSLSGWKLEDGAGHRSPLNGEVVAPGETIRIPLDGLAVQLSNKGGTLSLLDPNGLKVHGVAYTKQQASAQGWTVVF
ncbi:MAG TPA: DUF2278 family protein [Thermoanaerobaculia bacterium]|nr:DUF2278 family protein [Thermoanaerobaculia bacterium]